MTTPDRPEPENPGELFIAPGSNQPGPPAVPPPIPPAYGALPPPWYGTPAQPPQVYGYTPPPPPGYGQQPPPGYGYPPRPPMPSSNLAWAIASTLLCCLPAGIVSIVYATKVERLWHQGDYAGSQAASRNAMTWSIVSAAVGAVLFIIAFAFGFFDEFS